MGLEYRGMHNAHTRKVFVMHITNAYSNESKESKVSSFTRHICVFFCVLMVFIDILVVEEGVQQYLTIELQWAPFDSGVPCF